MTGRRPVSFARKVVRFCGFVWLFERTMPEADSPKSHVAGKCCSPPGLPKESNQDFLLGR
jgi:hypothetical protein